MSREIEETLNAIFYFLDEKDDVERMASWPTAVNVLDDRSMNAIYDWMELKGKLEHAKARALSEIERQQMELSCPEGYEGGY